jgi:hypothetical protein
MSELNIELIPSGKVFATQEPKSFIQLSMLYATATGCVATGATVVGTWTGAGLVDIGLAPDGTGIVGARYPPPKLTIPDLAVSYPYLSVAKPEPAMSDKATNDVRIFFIFYNSQLFTYTHYNILVFIKKMFFNKN